MKNHLVSYINCYNIVPLISWFPRHWNQFHFKMHNAQFVLQGMTNDIRFVVSVGDTTHAVYDPY